MTLIIECKAFNIHENYFFAGICAKKTICASVALSINSFFNRYCITEKQ